MLAAGSVTFFAGDSENEICFSIAVAGLHAYRFKISRVAFKTSGNNRPAEIGKAIGVSRAVHPLAECSPIRHWQLEEGVVMPVEIGLPLAARPNHNVHSLSARGGLAATAGDVSLKESVGLRRHFEKEIGILGLRSEERRVGKECRS